MFDITYQELYTRDDYTYQWRVYRQLTTSSLVKKLLDRMDETKEEYSIDDSQIEILSILAVGDHPDNFFECSSCQGRFSSLISAYGKEDSASPCPPMICVDCYSTHRGG